MSLLSPLSCARVTSSIRQLRVQFHLRSFPTPAVAPTHYFKHSTSSSLGRNHLRAPAALNHQQTRTVITNLPRVMPSHASIDQLATLAGDLSLSEGSDRFPNFYPESNPLDVYRAHLTNILQPITGVDPKIIYPAVQWTSSLDKGDLVVAAPALRVKGKKPDELVKEWSEKVSCSASLLAISCCRYCESIASGALLTLLMCNPSVSHR